MKFALALALLLAATLTGIPTLTPGARAEGIEVRSQAAQNRFPEGINFTVFLGSTADIKEVRLRTKVMPEGISVSTRPTCTTGTSVQCNALVGSTQSSYMVPGALVLYTWEIEDAAGNKLTTPEQQTNYADTRFQWQSITDANVTVFYYSGDENSNRAMLTTARETLDRIGQLEGTRVTMPIKVYVYATARDLQPAVASRRRAGPNNSVQTLGEVAAADTALVSRDSAPLDIIRHELAHIVTREASRGYVADLPVWINEGISTHAQRSLLPNEERVLADAIKGNKVLPITSLTASARGADDQVSLFYSQSGSIISFLVEKYGAAKFAEWIAAFRNENTEGATKKVYGFDVLGLENEWRKAVGLPEVSVSSAPSGSQNVAPTRVPLGSQNSGSSATPQPNAQGSNRPAATPRPNNSGARNNNDDGGSSNLPVIAAIIIGTLAAGGAGAFVASKKMKSDA